jgi:hypothetical protein
MKKHLLFILSVGLFHFSFSQVDIPAVNNYQAQFNQAYISYPQIPKGVLEAVSFCNTRFDHITHNVGDHESCIELPKAYGVMGLTLDGKHYFRNNLELVSQLSGFQIVDIITDPGTNISAYAKAYAYLLSQSITAGYSPESQISILIALSELPEGDLQNDFALNSQLYSIFTFLNNKEYQLSYSFPEYTINLENVFGQANFKVLSSPHVSISEDSIIDQNGNQYQKGLSTSPPPTVQSTDFGPAIWNPTTCNYSSRGGTAVSAITIHTVQGSYAGCISWFKNCNASVSAHYVARSSDGQITQMVRENQKGWHVGNHNPYTIGIEHEGYINNSSWYTVAMYTGSGNLSKDITQSGYGILPTSCYNGPSCNGGSGSCQLANAIRIKGHQHYSSQSHTDPGINWNWPYYYCIINNCNNPTPPPPAPTITSSNTCGDKTITRASPPSGTTYYWQGTSCGTSVANSAVNYTVTSSGTYYLRAKNSNGWSTCSSVTVTINDIPNDPPAPTTTTNPCGSQTLTRGTPPAGVTFYWQGTSCGTSTASSSLTYTAPSAGTYRLRARENSGGCWSNACSSVAVTVASAPATPAVPTASTNSCGSITLTMPNAPAGETYYWQGSSCGVSTTDASSTFIAMASGNYYLRSLSTQGCWSNCRSIAVSIIDCPENLIVSFGPCSNTMVNFSWINSNVNWTLQVSLDSAFSSYYTKPASNVTLLTGPAGFTPSLNFQSNATYYWRILTGNVYTNGPNFILPFCDVIPPTTVIAPIAGWQSSNFTANYTDTDNSGGSGLGKSFYRVIDFDGTEWSANGSRGFANDNFDNPIINPDWTNHTGVWANASGYLEQSDDLETNSNISTPLTQNLSNSYLYHWNAKIDGSGTNRKAGLHFFSDSASLPNRGNSYLVWFSMDDHKLEFYKVTNDVMALVKSRNYSFVAGQFYDFKLVYDRITGKMDIYINNIIAESWADATPISTGNAVSFRTADANMTINYFKTFRSRLPSVTVNVGTGNTNDIRFENSGPPLSAGKIESIVTDSAGNLSPLFSIPIDVDWTAPSTIAFINDGSGADIDSTYSTNELKANWSPSSDPNSGIAKYHYSIGTTPGATDLVASTDNFMQMIAINNPLPLVLNQLYYFNVRSENAAGLFSSVVSSNGQMLVLNTTSIEEENTVIGLNLFPNPFNNTAILDYTLTRSEKVQVGLYDLLGKEIVSLKNENQAAGNHKVTIDGTEHKLSKGLYLVVLKTENTSAFIKIVFQ